MRYKFVSLASVAACCALIASCGGDDEATPTPTPTSTATPTPTPSPTTINFNFSNAFTANSTGTAFSYAYFTPTGGAEVWSDGARRNGTSTITYAVSPESASYVWPDSATLTSFTAADLLNPSSTLRTYRKGVDTLAMERPFQHVLRVNYETTVPYTRETVAGQLRSLRYALFYNTVTTTADITANLSYTGTAQVAGGKPGTAVAGAFTSPAATMTVASSDKKLTGTITIVETVAGAPVVRAALPLSATVATNATFNGTIDDTANGFKGTFVGTLAGPAREEVLLIFNVAHTDGREFIGSYIGD